MKCIECGHQLSQEEIDVNMCWTCGHIINEDLVDEENKEIIREHNESLKNNSMIEIDFDSEVDSDSIDELKQKINNCMITNGYGFEGYSIIEYKGLVHAECSVGTGVFSELSITLDDFFGAGSKVFETKLSKAKAVAEEILIKKAVLKGGNAIIGVSFDVLTLLNNMIIVSANATIVRIEKNNNMEI